MSDHKTALVPLESWCYASPEILLNGKSIDVGLFAEALIYYDTLLVNLPTQPQFAEFLKWFMEQDRFDDLLALCRDGTIRFYDYGFSTGAIENKGSLSLWNIQDNIQAEPNTFEQRFLYHPAVETVVPKGRYRQRLYRALRDSVIEVKAKDFAEAIENAKEDYLDPRRNALIVQLLVDELYSLKGLGSAPEIRATISSVENSTKHQITWNIDASRLASIAGPQLNFHKGTPYTACGHSNRLLWSACQHSCDLYLPTPMSRLIGDKLYESAERTLQAGKILERLKETVDYPDVRLLVNQGTLGFADILTIRSKGRKFREWIQDEADRDRNAIIAYHKEVSRDSGLAAAGSGLLKIFGFLGGAAIDCLVSDSIPGFEGKFLGKVSGASFGYLTGLMTKLGTKWKPVIFGEWLRDRIEKQIRDKD